MKRILLVFLLLWVFISTTTVGQKYDSLYGKPLLVLVETDPWLMVIGSDVPAFALYERGQIIYKTIESKSVKYYEVTLTNDELQKITESMNIQSKIYDLQDNTVASHSTDQPENILFLNITQRKTITVYGNLREGSEDRKLTPKEFIVVYDNIKKYKNRSAKVWLPKQFEVMLWDYDYAPNKRPWIKGFPDLNSSTTVKFDNNSFSLFIDKSHFDEFIKYFKSSGEKEAVEINGRKMAMSYRLPFPNMN